VPPPRFLLEAFCSLFKVSRKIQKDSQAALDVSVDFPSNKSSRIEKCQLKKKHFIAAAYFDAAV